MKNFVIQHSVVPKWYFDKKHNYVERKDAYVFKDEKEFKEWCKHRSALGSAVMRQKLYNKVEV